MSVNPITIRMPKKDLEQWLAVLRHEPNQKLQGQGALFTEGNFSIAQSSPGYCCLGAAQCARTGGFVEQRSLPSGEWLQSVGWEFLDSDGDPAASPYFPSLGFDAVVANDTHNLTFAQIADAIEKCAEGY